jgi:hypothetical protein
VTASIRRRLTKEIMDLQEFASLFTGISLPVNLRHRLESNLSKPEGDVEARWVHRLIDHYTFLPDQIACGVAAGGGRNAATSAVFADIVVYRDKQKKEPFIVIEVKKPHTNAAKGLKQAESYARNLGAEYHVWSDWHSSTFLKLLGI